jgi:eukaryotic-like serine/threonine-protein kinase
MTLSAGSRLGPYEVLSPIGAGGMGEVYKARDTRLERTVAIKILPEAFAADRERLSRFEQEARAVSTLNHPNIVVVYDVGREGEASYFAMELVEGRTVRELTASGALPLKRALPLAAQIADGLAKAHAAGIVHRDLKPDNVIVNADGLVKILDFGLAKLTRPEAAELTAAPTEAHEAPRTDAGIVLGTAGYMSPEQAAGRPVDYRSDQFAFGSILYEMVTGRRAFHGGSTAESLAAIIQKEPEPVVSSQPDTPAPLLWLIERCLAKEPADRYESTRDLAKDLATLRDRTASGSLTRPEAEGFSKRLSRGGRLGWTAAALASLAAAVLAAIHFRERALRLQPVSFLVLPPERAAFSSETAELHDLALSPDGSRIAFVASLGGEARVWIRPLDALSATPLAGTHGASSPFWSPDGTSLGFFADGKLKTIAAGGGPTQALCAVANRSTGAWGRTGTILFTQTFSERDGLYAVAASGGEPRLIAGESNDFTGARWPLFLPDGRRFLFQRRNRKDRINVLVSGELGSPEIRRVAPIPSRVEISGGSLFYVREGVLVARAFDSSTLRFTGEAIPVAERIPYFSPTGAAPFSVSANGVIAYFAGESESPLRWLDRKGQTVSTVGPPGLYTNVNLSPDGRKAAVEKMDPATGTTDIWIADLARGAMTRLTADPGSESWPLWSPDGSEIAFVSHGVAPPVLRRKRVNETSGEEVLLQEGFPWPTDWSRDGKFIAIQNIGGKPSFQIWFLPILGDRKPVRFHQTSFREGYGAFSPDSRWVAFLSEESAVPQVYVAPSFGSARKWQVSSGGGVALTRPRWRGDGKEFFYVAGDGRLMSVPIKSAADVFDPGDPVALFTIGAVSGSGYDVAADGQRFLTCSGDNPGSKPITVMLNWAPVTGR